MDDTNIPLSRKRELILQRIREIQDALENGKMTILVAEIRFKNLIPLYEYYEEIITKSELDGSDDVELTKPNENDPSPADLLRQEYFDLMSVFEAHNQTKEREVLNSTVCASNATQGNISLIETQRLAKLPTTELPKFDGNFESWLSFKNTFKTLIDSRIDIDDTNKFLYLRGCLIGTARNKLSLYNASPENYEKAWKLLEETYQKERALVLRHYDAILNISPISKANTENLTKFIDDVRQHLNDLESLNASPTGAFVVRILELKLPMDIRDKWEETFTDDNTLPDFDLFCKFITKTAFKLSARKTDQQPNNSNQSFKRKSADRHGSANKVQRKENSTQVFATGARISCPHCKGPHLLYQCSKFKLLSIDQRVKFVRSSRLCPNCLRLHKGSCNSIKCKICNKFHHSLLHFGKSQNQQSTISNTTNANYSNQESNNSLITNKDAA